MYNENDLDKLVLNTEPPLEEPARQYYFMAKCRERVREFERENGRVPRACVTTFGCQMNARDSEKLEGILRTAGYETVSSEEADFVIFNTCTVRDNANQRVYGRLGELKGCKRRNPSMKIALCGCMMQEPSVIEKIRKSYPFVDLVFGTHNIYRFAELLCASYETEGMLIDIWKDTDRIVEDLPVKRKYPFKSGINIMFGCNNFCSYCIVPYVRGRERSREPEDILREIRELTADGVVEVMLLGQNVNSYGRNLKNPITFAELLREVEKIEGLQRIRFMTSHPKDLSDDLIRVMKESRKICRHLHLPLQSGSDRILKQMNRRYTREQYVELALKIRREIPDIAITTDIIVGFPGETAEDLEETIDVVRTVKFDNAFTFIYSRRTGTPAAAMENQVPEAQVKEGFDRLLKVVQDTAREQAAKYEGSVCEALIEEVNEESREALEESRTEVSVPTLVTGRLSNNMIVHVPGDASLVGKVVRVSLDQCRGFYYLGRIQKEPASSLLETTLNTRELGGYRTASGEYTKRKVLIRSDVPKAPGQRDVEFLLENGITTILDMRGVKDAEAAPSPFAAMEQFRYHNIPIEEGSSVPESVEAVPGSYMKIAESCNMSEVFRHISGAEGGVLFHCSAGKDRTGVVSAILLLLAGVSREDIVENYMLTKECNRERFALFHQRHPLTDINIVIPHEEYITAFLDSFLAKYGSPERYLEQLGLASEEIEQIRDRLLGKRQAAQ